MKNYIEKKEKKRENENGIGDEYEKIVRRIKSWNIASLSRKERRKMKSEVILFGVGQSKNENVLRNMGDFVKWMIIELA